MSRLLAAVPRDARLVEPRLSGGFPWAPFSAAKPATGSRWQLASALSGATRGLAPESRTVATAGLLLGKPAAAIALLAGTPEGSRDAATWNDLAAAQYVTGNLQEALVAADQALRLDPLLGEARFNRALIIEHYHLRDAAADAWTNALVAESDPQWAAEARAHLDVLTRPLATFASEVERLYPRLERGDRAVADTLVQLDAGDARYFGENNGLGDWGEAWLRGDAAAASGHLTAARTLAASLVAANGDPMLADAVAAIDRADAAAVVKLARAHAAFREGRRLFRKERKPVEAEAKLAAAAKDFESGGSPMALESRVYTGVAVLGQNRINKAEAMFESVEAAAPARYAALHGYIQWQRATCLMTRARWGGTIELLTHAIEEFERLRESNNAAYLHDILSQCYGIVGDRNRASRHRAIALRGLGNVTSYRLGHAVSGLVYDATQAKDWRAALSFVALEHHIAQRVGDQELLTEALVRRALLHARFGDQAAAGADLREAAAVVASVEDPTLHEKLTNDRNAAAALISTDPRTAIPMLTELLRFNETKGWRALIPGFYLRRGRMYRAIGDPRRAAADFEAGIAELEMHRESLPVGEERWGVLDAADELFDEATESALHTRPADAFAYAERERARSISDTLPAATSPAEAKPFDFASLPADAAIIEYAVLPDRLIVFAVDRSGCRAEERVIAREDLSEVLRSFTYAAQNGKRDTRAFDVLIAPVRDVVATHRELVFVPDAATALVPFAALSESRPLVEQHTIVVAPSARFFVQARSRESGSPRRSVLIVDNPSTETMASLSFASSEAAAIAREYAETRRLSGPEATTAAFLEKAREAAAIHFAGHGIVSGDSAALMLASGAADAATLSRGSVSGVVVLAACDTARGPVHAAEGVISVAHAFLQAGAPTVIATLWPIADEDAADFFPRLHRHLARGLPPAEALRLAQLEFMRDPRNERSTLWAAVQAIGN